MEANVTVIGGGPAGYVAAIRAVQCGARVALVEQGNLGGTCLNVGCIPTKALVRSSRALASLAGYKRFGIKVKDYEFDYSKAQSHKDRVVKKLVGGVQYLLKNAGVKVIRGTGRIESPARVAVAEEDGGNETITTEKIIIATGSRAAVLPFARPDGQRILDSTSALSLEEVPEHLVVIGGGVIGVEFAAIYQMFGSKVTVVELMPQLLPREDTEAAKLLAKSLGRSKIKIYTSARVKSVDTSGKAVKVLVETDGGEVSLEADKVLVSVGRKPNTEGIGLEKVGITPTRQGAIPVDEGMRTAVPSIFACGDVIGGFQLAHVAFEEGVVAAENATGGNSRMSYRAVPRCIFTEPEVAAVGLTEEEAREKYGEVLIGRFPFSANSKAVVDQHTEGFVKVIAEAKDHTIVGVVIVGPEAAELITSQGYAVALECTLEEVADIIHSHPSLSEALHEAALDALGRALHI